MKKFIYFCGVSLFASATLSSCLFEEDDIFGESAALRGQHYTKTITDVLYTPTNGWQMQYFANPTSKGYNIYCQFFENGSVILASDHDYIRVGKAGTLRADTSTYVLNEQDGPVLSFNSWNDILSVFTDPVDPKSGAEDGEGLQGDNEFVVTKVEGERITMRGERHEGIVIMQQCDRPWKEYYKYIQDFRDYITNQLVTTYYVTTGNADTAYFSNLRTGYFDYLDRLNDPLKKEQIACVFTASGFRMQFPDSLGMDTFQEFIITEDSSKLVSENGKIQCIPMWDYYVAKHTDIWNFNKEELTTEQQALYTAIEEEIKKYNTAWSLKSLGLGKSTGGSSVNGLVATCYTTTAKVDTKVNTFGLEMSFARKNYGEIEVAAGTKTDKNMQTVTKKATQMTQLFNNFAATLNGVYNVTPKNYFLPVGGTYTSDKSSFKVEK